MSIVERDLPLALGRAFDAARDGLREDVPAAEYERRRRDFVFHLTDCLDDLEGLSSWLRDPQRDDDDEAVSELVGMLYHIIPHLNAAGRLLLDEISDPFAGTKSSPRES